MIWLPAAVHSAHCPTSSAGATARYNAFSELVAAQVATAAKRSSDSAPDFTLPKVRGGTLRLREMNAQGAVVLRFYRGSWCPFCNI